MVATVIFESSQVPIQINLVLDPMAAKTCTGVALKCNAFGVPLSSLPHFDSDCMHCTAGLFYMQCKE